jgi:hypothetical protein
MSSCRNSRSRSVSSRLTHHYSDVLSTKRRMALECEKSSFPPQRSSRMAAISSIPPRPGLFAVTSFFVFCLRHLRHLLIPTSYRPRYICSREDPGNFWSLTRLHRFRTDCELIRKLIPRSYLALALRHFRRPRILQRFAIRTLSLASLPPNLPYKVHPRSVVADDRRLALSIGRQVPPVIAALLSLNLPTAFRPMIPRTDPRCKLSIHWAWDGGGLQRVVGRRHKSSAAATCGTSSSTKPNIAPLSPAKSLLRKIPRGMFPPLVPSSWQRSAK